MDNFFKRTWCEIDLDAIKHNFYEVKRNVKKDAKIMSVVKADAYGHGVKYVAKQLEEIGTDWFAVSNLEEAIQLRKYDIKKPILILGYTPDDMMVKVHEYDLSQTILSYEYGRKVISECKKRGIKVKSHFKIDTGMNRIGFTCRNEKEYDNSIKQIKELFKSEEMISEGIFTHFSSADDLSDSNYTKMQFDNFIKVINGLESIGIKFKLKHCCNSAGIINYPNMHLDMVRAGIILYGLKPSESIARNVDIIPAMSLKTVISQIKMLPKGSSVSYCRKYISDKDIKVATVPIGYADGYSTKFSNKSSMLINGKRVNVIGRVCMDQLMLDVSGINDICEGEIVTVFGRDRNHYIFVDELAKYIDSINYEIVCLIGKRVPRLYFSGKNIIAKTDYIQN